MPKATKNVTKNEFQIPSDVAEISKATTKVLDFLKPLALSEGVLFDIRLCLEEALINAMKYGHHFQKNLKVKLSVAYEKEKLRIQVEDQGPGFDPKSLKDCTRNENLLRNCGRGVYLMQQLMDQVKYNAKGNCLEMVKTFKKGAL